MLNDFEIPDKLEFEIGKNLSWTLRLIVIAAFVVLMSLGFFTVSAIHAYTNQSSQSKCIDCSE